MRLASNNSALFRRQYIRRILSMSWKSCILYQMVTFQMTLINPNHDPKSPTVLRLRLSLCLWNARSYILSYNHYNLYPGRPCQVLALGLQITKMGVVRVTWPIIKCWGPIFSLEYVKLSTSIPDWRWWVLAYRLPPKGECLGSCDLSKFWEIT